MENLFGCLQVEQSTVAIKDDWGKLTEVLGPWCLGSSVAGYLALRVQQLDVRCKTKMAGSLRSMNTSCKSSNLRVVYRANYTSWDLHIQPLCLPLSSRPIHLDFHLNGLAVVMTLGWIAKPQFDEHSSSTVPPIASVSCLRMVPLKTRKGAATFVRRSPGKNTVCWYDSRRRLNGIIMISSRMVPLKTRKGAAAFVRRSPGKDTVCWSDSRRRLNGIIMISSRCQKFQCLPSRAQE